MKSEGAAGVPRRTSVCKENLGEDEMSVNCENSTAVNVYGNLCSALNKGFNRLTVY